MKKLERDRTVAKWTKNRGIEIQYVTEAGNVRGYHPDLLLERASGAKELHEVKGGHYLQNPDTIRKDEAAKNSCSKRAMTFLVITKQAVPYCQMRDSDTGVDIPRRLRSSILRSGQIAGLTH